MCKGVNVCVAGSLGMSTCVNVPLQLELCVYLCGSGRVVDEGTPGGPRLVCVSVYVCTCK